MRSERDQTTAGKEKSVVEIQFRDAPREQESSPAHLKPKEEKKEVFTKVGGDVSHCLYIPRVGKTDMEGRRCSFQHRGQRPEEDLQPEPSSLMFYIYYIYSHSTPTAMVSNEL